ncbi:NAD-dependent epimerase/dehydratase family protein [Candidatus Chlorohelix sp.]|uniref:NAD-dependent epimerase/dehydratase family protein n=1 Tax=Candidatus Chlorohelix sp. TaxID=3139201 RepID=UPI0030528294
MSATNELHLVLGTGPLGKATMEALVKQGKRVRMVNRSGKATAPNGVAVVAGDVTNLDNAKMLCREASVIYLCAQPAYHRWQEEFEPYMTCAIEAASASSAKLIFGDNLYMYGEVSGELNENLPYKAQTKKGKVRARIATMLLEAHRAGKVRAAIGRASDFFGPEVRDSALGTRIFYPALAGKSAGAAGNLDALHTYTYIKDFGAGLATLGLRDEALGQTWHVPNAETLTTRQFLNMVFEEIKLPPKMSGISKTMMRMAGLFIPGARETVEMMYEFEKPFVVDSRKFEIAFGIKATSLKMAIHETVEWFKNNPPQKH